VRTTPGDTKLEPTTLKPGGSASIEFTPQEGLLQASGGGVEVGGGRRAGGGIGRGRTRPRGKGEEPIPDGRGGDVDVVIRQDVSVTVALWPPGATRARKRKTFRWRDLDRDNQDPLELAVTAEEAGREWRCVFTNAGRTEATVFGGVHFVAARREHPGGPAEVSTDAHAELPKSLLKPGEGTFLHFAPAEGLIEIYVFALEESPRGKPGGKIEDFPEGGDDPDVQLPQDVRVRVELLAPDSTVVKRGEFRLRTTRRPRPGDEKSEAVIQQSVSKELAGQEWRVRFVNAGPTAVGCWARVNFAGEAHRTELPLRILNNGLRQLVAAVGLRIRLDGKHAYIGVSDELAGFASGTLGVSLDMPIKLPVSFTDLNLFSVGAMARTDSGHPLIQGSAAFETRGVEIDDVLLKTDVDISRLALTVDVELVTVEFTELDGAEHKLRWEVQPATVAKFEVEAFAEGARLHRRRHQR
jgi:hypothetical protein